MDLEKILQNLPPDAPEAMVEANFSRPFLKALGFDELETIPAFPVSKLFVDHAARKNTPDDIFLHTKNSPFLYMEVKGRTENLSENHANYIKALNQLKRYLLDPSSKTVQWGLLHNSIHVQLFRKHGKVIHPVTPCLELNGKADKVVETIKGIINTPRKALVVAVYNNKGGVGKTTTTINLAATLTLLKKRVLVIDFDPNQSDLGDALNLPCLQGDVLSILRKKVDIRENIIPYKFEHPRLKEPIGFDVLPADEEFASMEEVKLEQHLKIHDLKESLGSVCNDYDYILIDAPPNWRIFAQKAIYAADAVLIPARHDNLHSLQNAAMAITKYIPWVKEARQKKGESGPIALPIFMNSAFKVTPAQVSLMNEAIVKIIKDARREGFDLTRYFYPKWKKGQKNDDIMIEIPYMAYISRADFMHVPGAFAYRNVRDQYVGLVKEYFI